MSKIKQLSKEELQNIFYCLKKNNYSLCVENPVLKLKDNLVMRCKQDKTGEMYIAKFPLSEENILDRSIEKDHEALVLLQYEAFVPKVDLKKYTITPFVASGNEREYSLRFQQEIKGTLFSAMKKSGNEEYKNYFFRYQNDYTNYYLNVVKQLYFNAALLENKYGIIHGDLHNGNIILETSRLKTYFIDFEYAQPADKIIDTTMPGSLFALPCEAVLAEGKVPCNKKDSYALSVVAAVLLMSPDKLIPKKIEKYKKNREKFEFEILEHIWRKKRIFESIDSVITGKQREYLGKYLEEIDGLIQLGIEPKYDKRWGAADLYGKAAALFIQCSREHEKHYGVIAEEIENIALMMPYIERRAIYNQLGEVITEIVGQKGFNEKKYQVIHTMSRHSELLKQVLYNIDVRERTRVIYDLKGYLKKYEPESADEVMKKILE